MTSQPEQGPVGWLVARLLDGEFTDATAYTTLPAAHAHHESTPDGEGWGLYEFREVTP
ncbi:hypothetical protein JOF41_007326 [Saccharothrix coeruleofusca]|uniref:hypothetical protein n=1 Tax=Saccharothrix coeruleofusca TaxID=33919 RepID=UPI001AEB868D|nr:hypothetical protein [Saccharothrix coeruleofusca]MBP2341072.1 hypothetical protein [Saccharothrix coeruleofusca]